jgi:hypothetical protein
MIAHLFDHHPHARAGFSGAAEGRVGGTRLLSAVGFLVGLILIAIQ